MAREFLYLVQESAFKTPVASPVVGTSAFYIRLDGGNAFTMRPTRADVEIPYGGGVAIRAKTVADKLECKGRLQTKLYAGAHSAFLLNWAAKLINGAQTSPWVTTEIPGDLASVTVYHAIQRADSTYKRRAYKGCKVDSWTLEISEDSTIGTLTLELSASEPQGVTFGGTTTTDPDATAFPAPTDAQLPLNPYVFINASGALTIGSARTQFSSVRITSRNVLARRFFAYPFVRLLRFVGRDTSLEANHYFLASLDDRGTYEAMTDQTCSFTLNNGTNSLAITLNAANIIKSVGDQLPLSDLYTQDIAVNNQYDPSAGADIGLTFT